MPQLQSLVLTDRATTPVAHTFTPVNIDANGVAVVSESAGVPIGEPRYTIQNRRSNGRFKVTLKLSVPVVQNQTVNGIVSPVIVRTAFVESVFTFDATSSESERNNVVGMFADSLSASKTLVNDTVVKLQGVY